MTPPREPRRFSFYRTLRVAFERFLTWTTTHPWTTLGAALLLSVWLAWAGTQLQIRANMADLFPESTPHLVRLDEIAEHIGYTSQIKLIFTSPDRDANIAFVDELSTRLRKHPDIARVESRRDVSFFRKNALLFLSLADLEEMQERVRTRIKRAVAHELGGFDEVGGGGLEAAGDDESDDELDEDFGEAPDDELDEDFGGAESEQKGPSEEEGAEGTEHEGDEPLALPTEEEIRERYGLAQFAEHFINADGTVIGINVFPHISPDDVSASQVLMHQIRGLVTELDMASYHPAMRMAVDGGYHRRINEMEAIKRDLANTSLFAGIAILLLIVLYFARLRAVLFVAVPLAAGIGWTTGVAYYLVGYLNTITAFIFTILFGLGVDFAIHAASRYYEERGHGREVAPAVIAAVAHLGRPMVWAALTTSVTFLSLSILRFRGFSQFGLIAGLGVLICLLALVVILPPLVVVAARLKSEPAGRLGLRLGEAPGFARTRRAGGVTLAITLVALLGFFPGLRNVFLDPDLSQVQTPLRDGGRELCERYKREVENLSMIPIISYTGSLAATRRVHDHLVNHPEQYPSVQTVRSIFSFLPEEQQVKAAIVDDIRERLRKKRGALSEEEKDALDRAREFLSPEPYELADLPPWVQEKFTDRGGELGTFLFIFSDARVTDAGDVHRAIQELDVISVDDHDYPAVATYFLAYDAFALVAEEGPIAMLLAAAAVLLVLLIDLRSLRRTLLAFLPLPLGIGAFLGLAGLCGWSLNMFNMVVLPTFFGIGVDTSIHLVHRGREELRRARLAGDQPRFGAVVGAVGAAAGMSSLTTAAGFSAMLLATNPGLASIGMLAPVGIFLCYLASVGVTGSLLWFWLRSRSAARKTSS